MATMTPERAAVLIDVLSKLREALRLVEKELGKSEEEVEAGLQLREFADELERKHGDA